MADGRMLKKKIGKNKELNALNDIYCIVVYTWLIPHLDIEGRYYGEPDIIKGEVFSRLKCMTEERIGGALTKLARTPLVIWYKADNGDRFLFFTEFKDNQKLRPDREAESSFPIPTSEQLQDNSGSSPPKDKLREVKLSKDKVSKELLLSPFLEDPKFKTRWGDWLEVRKKLKAPNTDSALQLALNKLNKYSLGVAAQMLEQSIERGWRGVFPLKDKEPSYPDRSKIIAEQSRKDAKELKERERTASPPPKGFKNSYKNLMNKVTERSDKIKGIKGEK